MGRPLKRLSARAVTTLTKPGRHNDGEGLYLTINAAGAKSWLFLFRWQGKLKELGLGGVSTVSLADARDKAAEARKQVKAGINPIEAKREAASQTEPEAVPTFGKFADDLVEDIKVGFRNAKHQAQWSTTLKTHGASLRPIPIDKVGTEQVLGVLKPIWTMKQETASRLRGRIERVLDAAKAKGHRTGENPARWRGHLDHLLPRKQKLQRGHHPAMPYADVPDFIAELRKRDATAAKAMEFLILCASRSGEVIGAEWTEIDLKAKVWTVPAERMKAGRPHRVPLTDRAIAILESVEPSKSLGEYVFAGARKGRPLSSHAMLMLLRRMDREQFTPHGFRSSFRDWAGECTSFPREVAEAALAHVIGDETERAYRRSDALLKRKKLMDAWAGFVGTPKTKGENVTPIRAKAG
ncbi:MAG: integrase arm-type DNA-binding domain-containing protein [Bosea sp.]|uniref:tyrosine-type recombinase/integrase n=1 Tax=Bosea sp. (in: a-proteobacteria) TaxID=1871050 RepID=UPI001AC6F858|nr:site-specific integrase [Bosea sp. (in: a-proteobacteria)]MBN9454292.1 integrase arm-type DNA-binding domain-containing protein [Bosea sp. (in: a-proteobacteria)]